MRWQSAIMAATLGSPLDLAMRTDAANDIPVEPSEFLRERAARYTRIANELTTRSDVFEIIVTAQAGYGYDEDGDGFINYRSDNEFIPTGEKKVRTVYERREPEDW